MANSRHIYWTPITLHTSGASQNNTFRCYDGTAFYAVTLTTTGAQWDSIYHLCVDLQAALRATYAAEYGDIVVDVDLNTGLVTLDNTGTAGGKTILPYPSTDSQSNFDVLLGGLGVSPGGTPATTYTYTMQHAGGAYIYDRLAADLGDMPEAVGQTATTLAGAYRGRTWASSQTREVEYQFITEAQFEALKVMFSDWRNNIILIDSIDATFDEYAENYIIVSPDKMPGDRVNPGLNLYNLSWTLGAV